MHPFGGFIVSYVPFVSLASVRIRKRLIHLIHLFATRYIDYTVIGLE